MSEPTMTGIELRDAYIQRLVARRLAVRERGAARLAPEVLS